MSACDWNSRGKIRKCNFSMSSRPSQSSKSFAALEGPDKPPQYVADFHVAEDGLDYVVTATILQPCAVRIEVHQTLEAPLPRVKVVEQSAAAPGPFERRIDARYRIHGHMLLMILNDDECCFVARRVTDVNCK